MAKSTLPNYVSAALSVERNAQIGTYAAVAIYVFAEVKADREVTELGERLHAASPHRTVKTWQNYAAACTALAVNAAAVTKLESVWSQVSDVADMAPLFQTWLEQQLKVKGYTTSVDDVANYAKGKPSIKAKAKAEREEQARLEAEASAAALAASKAPAPVDAPPVVDGDPVNPLPPITGAPTGDEDGTKATGYEPAIEPTIVSLMRAFVKGDELVIQVEPHATRADLTDILEFIQAKIDQMPPEASTLPVIDVEMAAA